MSKSHLKIEAYDKNAGMNLDELSTVLAQARTMGYIRMGRTQVGFKGQIQTMTFLKEDHEKAPTVRGVAPLDPDRSGGDGGDGVGRMYSEGY